LTDPGGKKIRREKLVGKERGATEVEQQSVRGEKGEL